MFRYSLRKLFAATLVIAFFCAALASATPLWGGVTTMLTFLVLLGVVVVALCSQERTRAFATGMAVFGWVVFYLLVGDDNAARWPSTQVMDWVYVRINGELPQWSPQSGTFSGGGPPGSFMMGPPGGQPPPGYSEYLGRRSPFLEIGDMFIVLVLSLVGGMIGWYTHVRSNRRNADSPDHQDVSA